MASARWTPASGVGIQATGNGGTITSTRDWLDTTLGAPAMSSGVWQLEVTINKSLDNDGNSLAFGVADGASLGQGSPCAAWCVYLFDGTVFHLPDARLWEGNVIASLNSLKLGARKGVTPGTKVGIRVDADAGSLAFRAQGGEWVDVGAKVPSGLRPYALLFFKDDGISLSDVRKQAQLPAGVAPLPGHQSQEEIYDQKNAPRLSKALLPSGAAPLPGQGSKQRRGSKDAPQLPEEALAAAPSAAVLREGTGLSDALSEVTAGGSLGALPKPSKKTALAPPLGEITEGGHLGA